MKTTIRIELTKDTAELVELALRDYARILQAGTYTGGLEQIGQIQWVAKCIENARLK